MSEFIKGMILEEEVDGQDAANHEPGESWVVNLNEHGSGKPDASVEYLCIRGVNNGGEDRNYWMFVKCDKLRRGSF